MSVDGPVLRDIHLPPSAAWWPPAPGWWLLAALVGLAFVAGAWMLRRRRHRRPLAVALHTIDQLAAAFDQDGDATALADGASRLLRRVARRVEPAAASASGETWRAFVRANARDDATGDALEALLAARYRARPELDAEALLTGLRAWCRSALGKRHAAGTRVETSGQRTQATPT